MLLVMLPRLVCELSEHCRCDSVLGDRVRVLGEFLHLEEHPLTCFVGSFLLGDEGADILDVCIRYGDHCWRAAEHFPKTIFKGGSRC